MDTNDPFDIGNPLNPISPFSPLTEDDRDSKTWDHHYEMPADGSVILELGIYFAIGVGILAAGWMMF